MNSLNSILEEVSNFLEQQQLSGAAILLAVSGGVDSVAMLHVFCHLSERFNLKLEVAHVDHGLRVTSGRDAEFVSSLAQDYQLKFHLLKSEAPARGVNVESWGRTLRYDFFNKTLVDRKLDWICTAHTKDDQLETVLMQLLSNKTARAISRVDLRRRLLRPMLLIEKNRLIEFMAESKHHFVEDESNQSESYFRNKVRLRLVPEIKDLFGNEALESIRNQSQRISEDLEQLDLIVGTHLQELALWNFGSMKWLEVLSVKLGQMAEPLSWRLIEQVCLPIVGFKIGRESALGVREVVLRRTAGVDLPGGFRVLLAQSGLRLVKL